MTSPHPDTVAIHRLRIQSAAGPDAAVRQRHVERLRREIECSDWPEAPGESWVFVRRVRARGPRAQLARTLTRAARREVESGDSGNVMRFAHLTDLLAALLTDLVQGRAAGRWYWRRWAHLFRLPLPRALASLLAEHGTQLASVCARLARQRTLARIWRNLDETGAYRLATELAWRGGFRLPPPDRLEAALAEPLAEPEAAPARMNDAIRQRWAPVAQSFAPADSRLQLALVLIGQEIAPLMLQKNPAGVLAQLAKTLNPALLRTGRTAPRPPEPVPEDSLSAWPDSSEAPSPAKAYFRNIAEATQSGGAAQRATAEEETPTPLAGSSEEREATESGNAASGSGPCQAATPEAHRPVPRFAEAPRDPAFDYFPTRQGGLLYLLNFLNRPEARTQMENFREQLSNGWGWLYRLGQELRLDETDPIVPFIATQLGFDHPGELTQLPPLPARESLLTLTQRWYGRDGLWQPELLRLSGRIRTSPSHVDLYAPLDAVRLPVRLAGLDINPGWLPWLGRVVGFHYD